MTATDLDETSTVASTKSSESGLPAVRDVEKKKKNSFLKNETLVNLKAKATALLPSTTKDRRDDTCESHVVRSSVGRSSMTATTNTTTTSMFVIRHGDRWDYAHPKWKTSPNTKRPGDPPLSDLGLQQARETGIYLSQVLREEQFTHLHVLVSPFLRTIETANEIVSQMERRLLSNDDDGETSFIPMKLECCVWEIESDDPAIAHINEERYRYFPRTDMAYKTMFVPKLPESKEDSLIRCERAMEAIEEQFVVRDEGNHKDAVKLPSFSTNNCNKVQQVKQAVIVVTHAAVCIGLAKAATKCTLQDINPAGPCSIYRFNYCGDNGNRRRSTEKNETNEKRWTMDHYAMEGGHNGHMKHISEWGKTTIPWNSFGHRTSAGHSTYTGPPRKEIEHLFQVPPARWY